jgi:hypothetical protein
MRLRHFCANVVVTTGIAGALLATAPTATGASPHEGWLLPERVYGWDEQRSYNATRRQSWYTGREEAANVAGWAIGTFRGQNGANDADETVTIYPDGSAELRVRGEAPRYGSFAGETLTFDRRVNRVQPARGGIVIDGAYYGR